MFLRILLMFFLLFNVSVASDYPNRQIEMVIPFDAGSGTDITARILGELVEEYLGVKITFNNRPGGAGATGYTYIKNSKPDGYTIGLANSTIASHKIFGNLPFDYHDVNVIVAVHSSPSVLCVPNQSKYHSLEDIMHDAKERPGKISWATSSGNALICSKDFFYHSGLEFKVIPSGGGTIEPAIQASGGHVDMALTNFVDARMQIEAGLLRPIVVYSKNRLKEFAEIPTFEELGFPVRCPLMRFIIAPPGVDSEKLEILNDAFQKAIASKRYQEYIVTNSSIALNAAFGDAVALLDEQKKAFVEVAKQRE